MKKSELKQLIKEVIQEQSLNESLGIKAYNLGMQLFNDNIDEIAIRSLEAYQEFTEAFIDGVKEASSQFAADTFSNVGSAPDEIGEVVREAFSEQERNADRWTRALIIELLDSIGQEDSHVFISDSKGISTGEWGKVRFDTDYTLTTLYLTFESSQEAKSAFEQMEAGLSNPYEFGMNSQYMPTTVLVQFTEN